MDPDKVHLSTAGHAKDAGLMNAYLNGGPPTDADAQALITNGNITDSTQQAALHTFFLTVKALGIYGNLVLGYLAGGTTEQAHKLNMVNPLNTNAAGRLTYSGAGITHNTNGWASVPAAGGYADTNYSASLLPGNNFTFVFHSSTDEAPGYQVPMGTWQGVGPLDMQVRTPENTCRFEAGDLTHALENVLDKKGTTFVGLSPDRIFAQHNDQINELLGTTSPIDLSTAGNINISCRVPSQQHSAQVVYGAYVFNIGLALAQRNGFRAAPARYRFRPQLLRLS